MVALSIALALVLTGVASPARNARPTGREASAEPAPAQELSDQEVADRVQTYLASIDTPITASKWRALGQRAVPALEAVVQDREALPSRRAKAVEALSIIGGPRAKQLVVETARSDREPYGVRASALRGAGRLLPPKELVTELRPVMEKATRGAVRAAAAEVLARHAGSSACTAVRAQAARERGHDRTQFSRALESCTSTTP